MLVAAEAEVEREGIAKLQQPRVRTQVPGLDRCGPLWLVPYAIGQQLLQHVLFADEVFGFFHLVALGLGPSAGVAEERVQEPWVVLGVDARCVKPVGVQADE